MNDIEILIKLFDGSKKDIERLLMINGYVKDNELTNTGKILVELVKG